MTAPGGAATVRLSLTISLSTFGFVSPMEAAQFRAPTSGLPSSLGSLVSILYVDGGILAYIGKQPK